MEFRYKLSCKLIGDRTRKPQLLLDVITESQFTDGAALCATSNESFVTVTQSFADVASSWGLTVSLVKTEGMRLEVNQVLWMVCQCMMVELVKEFPYLGSTISNDGEGGQ